MIMYGSTTGLHYFTKDPNPSSSLWVMAGLFKGQYELVAGLSTSGTVTTWFREQFGQDLQKNEADGGQNAYAALAEEASDSPVGANGLIFLPYMSGERTPIFDPKARGVIAGLSLCHTRGDVYRSILEGTAFAIRMNLEAMLNAGAQFKKVVAVGGGTKNRLWLQIVSDVTGITQLLPEKAIGASYGDAFLAGLATGLIDSPDRIHDGWVTIIDKIIPNQTNWKFYEKKYAQFKKLYRNTRLIVHTLADQQA
jgi:xylulokinase